MPAKRAASPAAPKPAAKKPKPSPKPAKPAAAPKAKPQAAAKAKPGAKPKPSPKKAVAPAPTLAAEALDRSEFDPDGLEAEGEGEAAGAPTELAARAGQEDTLFHRIDQGRGALTSLADKVVARFQRSPNEALLELVTLVFSACNCDCHLRPEQLEEEPGEVFMEALQALPPNTGEYAIGSHEKRWKRFTGRFTEFWSHLIRTANRGPLWGKGGDGFLQHVKPALACLSTSSVRSLRHTATVAVYACVAGLIDLAKKLRRDAELAGAEKKGPRSPAAKAPDLQQKLTTLEGLIMDLHNDVFVVRYRDIVPDIRLASIQALSSWIQTYPAFFLSDTHTKYLGWALSDRDPQIREAAVKALQGVFALDQGAARMQQFTQHFLERICEMGRDVKSHVAAESVRLIGAMFGADTKLLDPSRVEDTLAKVLDPLPAVRQQGARFFRNFLRVDLPCEQEEDARKVNRQRLEMVVDFMDCYNFPEAATYVVDCMWDVGAGFLYDWEQVMESLMAHLTAMDQDGDAESRKDHHTLGLVHGIVLKLNDRPLIPEGAAPDGKAPKLTGRLNATQKQEGLRAMSELLAGCLPDLTVKFRADPLEVVWLAEIVQGLDLSVYSDKQLDKWFQKLLEALHKLFFEYDRPDVLQALAKTWHVLTTADFPLQADAVKRHTAMLKALETAANKSTRSSDAQGPARVALWRRIAALYHFGDLNDRFWERILTTAVGAADIDPAAMEHVATAGFLGAVWKIRGLLDQSSVGEEPEVREDIAQLTRHLVAFLAQKDVDPEHAVGPLQAVGDLLYFMVARDAGRGAAVTPSLKPEELAVLVDVWERLLGAEGARFAEKKQKDAWACRVQKATVALCRVVPANSPACFRILTHYNDDPALLDLLRHHRSKVWRFHSPREAWQMEFQALTLLYGQYLTYHGQQEEQALQAFHRLALQFSKEHLPHFAVYKKDFGGSVARLLRAGVDFVLGDPLPRCRFLSGMRYFCPKLLHDEATALLAEFRTRCAGMDQDLLGHGDQEELRLFEEAVLRATGAAKDAPVEKKARGRRKAVDTSMEQAEDTPEGTTTTPPPKEWRGRADSNPASAGKGAKKSPKATAKPKPKPKPAAQAAPATPPRPRPPRAVAEPVVAEGEATEEEEGEEEEVLIASQPPSQPQRSSRRSVPALGSPAARPSRAERAAARLSQSSEESQGEGELDLISSQPSQELSQVLRARGRR